MPEAPLTITDYHAHIYYDSTSRETAALIREALSDRFQVRLGRWHDQPVGPHPQSMYQVVFLPHQFGEIVPWLILNHNGLAILIHPQTGDDVIDHTEHALWLGKQLDLNIAVLQQFTNA